MNIFTFMPATNIYTTFNDDHNNCRHEIFPEFRNFHDLRGNSRGNCRSDLIFMGGGGGGGWGSTIYSVCSLSVSNAGAARHKSSQASGVYTMSTFTSTCIYYNSLIFCIVCVCTSLLILKTVVCHFKTISGYNSFS